MSRDLSYLDKLTEKEMRSLEKKLADVYAVASAELKTSAEEYFANYKIRWQKEHEAYKQGKYTKAQWDAWQISQLGRGELWTKKLDEASKRMSEINQVASSYINDTTPGIYSLNYNYSAYMINQAYPNTTWDIYNEQTVRELVEGGNHVNFRTVKVNPKRDYEWNAQKIQNTLVSGIIQGKSINQMTDSFTSVMKRNRNAAIRNARTAVTSAQNGGRQETYERAEEMGIQIEKEWIATLDERTRDTHQALDGQRVPYDDVFVTENGDELMYPGDPSAEPCEVYNCRCTMVAVLPETSGEHRMTYTEWAGGTTVKPRGEDKAPEEKSNTITNKEEMLNKSGQPIMFNLDINENPTNDRQRRANERSIQATNDLRELSNQYDTYLFEVRRESAAVIQGAGDTDVGGTMRLANLRPDTYLHEFAHSLASQTRVKTKLADDREVEFEKKLAKLFRRYQDEYNGTPKNGFKSNRDISISSYSHQDKDEFMAEAFAYAKMKEKGYDIPSEYDGLKDTTYVDELMELVNKYFKKK